MVTAVETTADERAKDRVARRGAADLQPGSKWRVLRGDHAGAIVEVTGYTRANRVRFHPVDGGSDGANAGNGHFDDSSKWTKPLLWFLGNYTLAMPAPQQSQVTELPPAPVKQQLAWRQTNRRPPKPAASPAQPQTIVVGEVNTRDAEFNVSLEAISPDRATAWLSRGGTNRHLNDIRVAALAAAIKRNEWRITGDTIKLDKQGRVRDGQHRLAAIAAGATTVQALVVFGVDEDAFAVMDTGRSRSIGDQVGLTGLPDRTALSSAARSMLIWEDRKRLIAHAREAALLVTAASTIKYLREHPSLIECVSQAEAIRHDFPGGKGLWGALLYLFRQASPGAADEFVDGLVSGAGLQPNDAVLVLRNRLLTRPDYWRTKDLGDKEALAASIVKAWNFFRAGESLETGWRALHWRNIGRSAEPFPVPQ